MNSVFVDFPPTQEERILLKKAVMNLLQRSKECKNVDSRAMLAILRQLNKFSLVQKDGEEIEHARKFLHEIVTQFWNSKSGMFSHKKDKDDWIDDILDWDIHSMTSTTIDKKVYPTKLFNTSVNNGLLVSL